MTVALRLLGFALIAMGLWFTVYGMLVIELRVAVLGILLALAGTLMVAAA